MAEAVTINTGWTSEKLPFFKNQIQLMKGKGRNALLVLQHFSLGKMFDLNKKSRVTSDIRNSNNENS